ncbi:TonB-dependent receptor [Sphingopyxis panaciterrulae]|uniref:Iron complex outermembrane receptor protein n=1 Tax=Sphingopyxis panaciterrulae TaxID=462372 RepID=A0A7W9B529_9SPHN|nr:TonB-dependent receptor [Sphingopyxis panaciterrulae]MBB5706368.1 iron complex outermembrane receptor protein [Sphingopyxis panaciterrulae]
MTANRISARRRLSATFFTFASLLALASVPATAETDTDEDVAATDTTADDTAAADQGSYGGDILVTARRRAETAQDVPIAISVVGGDQIDNTGSFNVGRLQQLAPALQYYSSNPRNSAVNIRGIGAPFGLTNDGIEQGVGIYVDDVYYARVASSTFDFLDVAQIEVLRGPQGTLYGKNTTAGAINITTNQPTFDFEGKAELSIGNLNFKQAKTAVSGPLSDTLAARIAVSATSRRGTIYNVTTDRWIQSQDNIGLRGQLLWRPTDNLDVTLTGDWNRQDAVCCGSVFVRTGATQRPLNRQFAALAAAQGYAFPSTNPYDRLTDLDANLNAGNEIGGVALRVKWDIGPGTLTSITAWRYWDWQPENDRDFTGLPVVTKSQNPSQQNQYTQELRYNVSSERFDFVLGGFAFYQRIDTQGTEGHGPASSRWTINPSNPLSQDPSVLDGLTAINTQYLKNTSLALFGQLSWKVSDRFSIQPGLRLNYDKKDGYYQRLVVAGDGSPVTRDLTDPVSAARLAVFNPQEYAPSFSDWNFSYDLTATWKPTSGILLYATYAKTFKSGGINQNGVPNGADGNPLLAAATIKPESVQHYEAGAKAEFWDRRGTFNLSIFRTDIKNYQANVNNGQFGVLRGYLANTGKVRTQGVEADFSIRPSERFRAYANGAYTDAKYVRFVDAPCPPELSGGADSPPNCDISGQRLPGVSKWAFSFGAEANAPARLLDQAGEVYLGYDGSYRSNFSSNASASAYTWIDGYALSNFRAGFRTEAGLDIFAWVRNAFDKNYIDQLFVGPGNTGLITGLPGDPRTWGGTIKTRF